MRSFSIIIFIFCIKHATHMRFWSRERINHQNLLMHEYTKKTSSTWVLSNTNFLPFLQYFKTKVCKLSWVNQILVQIYFPINHTILYNTKKFPIYILIIMCFLNNDTEIAFQVTFNIDRKTANIWKWVYLISRNVKLSIPDPLLSHETCAFKEQGEVT